MVEGLAMEFGEGIEERKKKKNLRGGRRIYRVVRGIRNLLGS